MFRSQALPAGLLAILFNGVASATTVTLDVDFESPTFTVGPIGGNPPYTAGQGGWGYYSPGSIVDTEAHGGAQSLRAGGVITHGATKSLDPATQGEYPTNVVNFPTGYASDWWVQAWVRVDSGGVGARMSLPTWGWYLEITGNGTPTFESVMPGQPPATLPSLGASVLDQWVFVQMAHNSATDGCGIGVPGRCIDFTIRGASVDLTFSRYYTASGPLSQYLMLSGDAYWDDVSAGTGLAPTVVPLPAAGWLLAGALTTLAGRRRAIAGQERRHP